MDRVTYFKKMEELFKKCLELSKKKSADYATEVDPFSNFNQVRLLNLSREKGILVRMLDKISRLNNLLTKDPDVEDESIKDTCMDMLIYSGILYLSFVDREEENAEMQLQFTFSPRERVRYIGSDHICIIETIYRQKDKIYYDIVEDLDDESRNEFTRVSHLELSKLT